ncbi:MAG: DNA polymerase IV [Deltaproteobacteria bacterium]|nr:DNA polymerase IV [Deltaproteobacteria bacterium]
MPHKDIIHLDMDAFYPAVEVLDDPSLEGKPVIVGGQGDRGVVSSASYEARKFGVHSAQPIITARRLCPDGIFLPVRMARYVEISKKVFEVFCRFTPLVEPLSIDEAFLDVTGSRRLFGSPQEIAKKIKKLVKGEIGLTVSAGIAPSKLVAKIASDLEKPDGLTVVPHGKVREFLDPLPIEKLWGVGKVTRKDLELLGVRTIGDLSRLPRELLKSKFGKHGLHLYTMAGDMDERDVETRREVKSIGHEVTYAKDIVDLETVKKKLLALATQVARRMRRKGEVQRFCADNQVHNPA